MESRKRGVVDAESLGRFQKTKPDEIERSPELRIMLDTPAPCIIKNIENISYEGLLSCFLRYYNVVAGTNIVAEYAREAKENSDIEDYEEYEKLRKIEASVFSELITAYNAFFRVNRKEDLLGDITKMVQDINPSAATTFTDVLPRKTAKELPVSEQRDERFNEIRGIPAVAACPFFKEKLSGSIEFVNLGNDLRIIAMPKLDMWLARYKTGVYPEILVPMFPVGMKFQYFDKKFRPEVIEYAKRLVQE